LLNKKKKNKRNQMVSFASFIFNIIIIKIKNLKFLNVNFQILFQLIHVHEIQFIDIHQIEVKK